MKALSGKAFCRLLERHGWQLLRVQGSHHVYGKAGQRARISVPVHGNRPLKLGLQRHLLKLAGIDQDEYSVVGTCTSLRRPGFLVRFGGKRARWSGIRMDEIAGGDRVRIELASSSEIEQSVPDARKTSRSVAGPPHRDLLWRSATRPASASERRPRRRSGEVGEGCSTMAVHPLSASALSDGIDRLAQVDPDVARALERVGYPAPRQREPGFATLLRIMVAQQLSTRSAAAIWGRLEAACGPAVSAERFLELEEAAFGTIGFSRQKVAHGRALAEAVAGGALDLEALASVPEEDAIAAIAALRGFGRWSAEVYLLFALGRADIFPGDDLGLQVGMQRLKRLEARPSRKAMDALAEPWRPLRGCGAIFLWHYYGAATLDEARPPPAA